MISVAIHGDGQLATGVADRLARRTDVTVVGPEHRSNAALDSGADVVLIATTTRLTDVAADIDRAVMAGSNVIVSAEEAAFPWNVDNAIAERINAHAVDNSVTVVGGGLNPGFLFDAFVLTLLGTHPVPESIAISRVVDLSRFGAAVQARLGLGFSADEFRTGRERGEILGHAGFVQSMRVVGDAIGLPFDEIDAKFTPIYGDDQRTAGFHQTYSASTEGVVWFVADFIGHIELEAAGFESKDTVTIVDEFGSSTASIAPGVTSQEGSVSIIVNSIERVMAARPGWVTVAELPPAFPRTNRKGPS